MVLEACGISRWVAQIARSHGHEVVIANPRRLAVITSSTRKSDRNDAYKLADLGQVRPRLLSPVVSAATYILGPFGPDSDLRRYGQRVASSGSQSARAKARIAVARKLAVLLHRLWLTGEVYRPLREERVTA